MVDSGDYFATSSGRPQSRGRFLDFAVDSPLVEMLPGLRFRPAVGDAVMVAHVEFDPHVEAPMHSHEEEQITVVLDGELEYRIGDEVRVLRAGEAALVPSFVPHGARTLDSPCREIDIFSPPRVSLIHAMIEAEHATHGFD